MLLRAVAVAGVGVESVPHVKVSTFRYALFSDTEPGRKQSPEQAAVRDIEVDDRMTPHCVIPRNTDAGITKDDAMSCWVVFWRVDTVEHRGVVLPCFRRTAISRLQTHIAFYLNTRKRDGGRRRDIFRAAYPPTLPGP